MSNNYERSDIARHRRTITRALSNSNLSSVRRFELPRWTQEEAAPLHAKEEFTPAETTSRRVVWADDIISIPSDVHTPVNSWYGFDRLAIWRWAGDPPKAPEPTHNEYGEISP